MATPDFRQSAYSYQTIWYVNATTSAVEYTLGLAGSIYTLANAWSSTLLAPTPLNVDASGNLLVNVAAGGGGGGNSAAGPTGVAVPANADYLGFSGAGGLLTGVSALNPLPCTFTGSAGNAAAGLTGIAVPTSADYSGWNSGGNLIGTSLATALPVQPGTGATFPVSGAVAVSNFPTTQNVVIAAGPGTSAGNPLFTSGGGGSSNPIGIQPASASVAVTQAVDNPPMPVTGTVFIGNQPGDLSQAIPVIGNNTDDIVAVAGIPIVAGSGVPVVVQGTVPISGTVIATNPSVGVSGAPPPTSLTAIGIIDQVTGNLTPLISGDNNADGDAVTGTPSNMIGAEVYAKVFNGNTFDRMRGNAIDGTQVYISPTSPPVNVTGAIQILNQVGDLAQEIPVVGRVTADLTAINGVPFTSMPVVVQNPTVAPAVQAVSSSDGALGTIGFTTDQPQYGITTSTLMAQIKGLNDTMQAMLQMSQRQYTVLQAILAAQNATGGQLGAAPVDIISFPLQ